MGSAIKRDGCCPGLGEAGGLKAGLRIALLAGPARPGHASSQILFLSIGEQYRQNVPR